MNQFPHYQLYLDTLTHAQMSYWVTAWLCVIGVLWLVYIRQLAPRFLPAVRWGSLAALVVLMFALAVAK